MRLREEFEFGLQRYRKLFMMWIATTAFLLGAQMMITSSLVAAIVFFILGTIMLGVSGVSCAYVVARDNA